jgi:hypothetical protein
LRLIIAFILLLSATIGGCSTDQRKKPSHSELPQALLSTILRDFPSSSLPSEAEYPKEGLETNPAGSVHWFCSSDFNGDHIADYAVLIRQPNKSIYVVAYLAESGRFEKAILDTVTPGSTGIAVALSICEKGSYEGIDETVVIANPAIEVQLINESLTMTYYWSEGHFVKQLWD